MPVKKGSTATDSLEHYIKLSYDSKFSQERQRVFSNKAYKIGMESGNDSLLYKGLYTKIEHDLTYIRQFQILSQQAQKTGAEYQKASSSWRILLSLRFLFFTHKH